jgi:hypothetical protein
MRIVVVTRHTGIYEGENSPPDVMGDGTLTGVISGIQDIDVPEVFDMASEEIALKRTLHKYVSTITAAKLMKTPNEQVGNYILCHEEKRYTLVMILQMEVNGESQDFGLHLADIFCG